MLQSRPTQHSLWILDVSGAGDCFFWVVSHKLYGEPGYHMNVRSTGVQFMSNNPERFIESSTNHLWSRYLAYMGWFTCYTCSCRCIKLANPRYRISAILDIGHYVSTVLSNEAPKYLVKTSELFQNEYTEVQENWLDNPDTRANDALANQSNKWKEFLSNLHASTDNAEIHSTDSVPEITK